MAGTRQIEECEGGWEREQVGKGPGRVEFQDRGGASLRVLLSHRGPLKVVRYSPCLWAPELSREPGPWNAQETFADLNKTLREHALRCSHVLGRHREERGLWGSLDSQGRERQPPGGSPGSGSVPLSLGQMLSARLGLVLLSPQTRSMARKGQQPTDGRVHSLHKGVPRGC